MSMPSIVATPGCHKPVHMPSYTISEFEIVPFPAHHLTSCFAHSPLDADPAHAILSLGYILSPPRRGAQRTCSTSVLWYAARNKLRAGDDGPLGESECFIVGGLLICILAHGPCPICVKQVGR